jgi:hypothetical protein
MLNNSGDYTRHQNCVAKKRDEKMLIEKDGKFRLISAEEWTAEERRRLRSRRAN